MQPPQQFESEQAATQQPTPADVTAGQQFAQQTAPTQPIQSAQQPTATQQPMAQSGMQSAGASQGMRLQDVETPQQRAVVDGVARAQQVCEWCADQCIQHGDQRLVECIRLCEDVAELSETVLAFVPRNSRFSRRVLQSFVQAARACQQECGKHAHVHCQECAQTLGQTIPMVEQYLTTLQQGSQPIQQAGEPMGTHQPGL